MIWAAIFLFHEYKTNATLSEFILLDGDDFADYEELYVPNF
jgi:hypothetical protein